MDKTIAVVKKTILMSGNKYYKSRKVTAILELTDTGQGAYFAATVDEKVQARNNRWIYEGGGADHDTIRRLFPKYAKYLKWHLVSFLLGPMHYKADAAYWLGFGTYGDHNIDNFKKTVIYGALPGEDDDSFPQFDSVPELDAWLDARYPALMDAFCADMRELFG